MEEATIATIATEALKPFSGVIDALLSTKLKRLKLWSERQELNSRLESIVIDNLLDNYLRRLLKRVCGITTIAFPQQVLPLTSIYEPLKVRQKTSFKSVKRTLLSLQTLKMGNNCIIVDSAGMGKSTYAKHLAIEILNSADKIPIFLELRRIDDTESLLEKLTRELDETQDDIDEELLLMLLDEGGFVIILDGYDELTDQTRERIGPQITELAIRCDKNSLILTARPEVNLPEIPDSKIFTIDHLERKQAESLVLRYDAVAKIGIGKELIGQFDLVSEAFLQTPLLVVLLYRTFGFNRSIATKITSFYDDVFNAFYKGHDLSKAGFARPKLSELDAEDFRRLLRGFSFLLSARQIDNLKSISDAILFIEEAIKLTSIKPVSPSTFLDDLLLTVPLLTKDGTEIRFIHKSIREFFSAEFLAYTPQSEPIIEKIRDGNLKDSFINPFQYLSELNPSLFRRLIVAPLAKKILAEKRPIKDPYIRTVCFLELEKASLGLWNSDLANTNPDPRYAMKRGEMIITLVGSLQGEEYELTAARSRRRTQNIPSAAWQLITKDGGNVNTLMERLNYGRGSLDGVDSFLVPNEWVAIDDERILSNSNNPTIRALLAVLISDETHDGLQGYVGILDEQACKDLLAQIEQEVATHSWLESLISRNNQ
jgi:hypothetical protein